MTTLTVKVNGQQLIVTGTSPATYVDEQSFKISDNTSKKSTLAFTVVDVPGTLRFADGMPVEVKDDQGNLLFAGEVLPSVTMSLLNNVQPTLLHQLTCGDWHIIPERRIICKSYANTTADAIVQDIITNYLVSEGITAGTIAAGPTVTQDVFNYTYISDALDDMATRAGFIWYVDYTKKLFFVPRSAYTAPWVATAADIQADQLPTLEYGTQQYRNKQYIRGGKDKTSLQTEIRKGDGNTKSWTMGYPLSTAPKIVVPSSSPSLNGSSSYIDISTSNGVYSLKAGIDCSKSYTTNSDLDAGTFTDTNDTAVPNQIQLNADESQYRYRKSHVINGSTDGDLTGYQVMLVIYPGSGTDSGNTIYLNGHSMSWTTNTGPGDIRFTNAFGTSLSYWIDKSVTTTGVAYVWVNIDSIPTSGCSIYVYYGKSDDAGTSSMSSTFAVRDDFSVNRIGSLWSEDYGFDGGSSYPATHTVQNDGYNIISSGDHDARLCYSNSLGSPYVYHVTLAYTGWTGRRPPWTYFGVGFGNANEWVFGYWGSVLNGFNPVNPADTIHICWTDGAATTNFKVMRNYSVVATGSSSVNTTYKPDFALRTAGSESINAVFSNFFAVKYTANEPTHGATGIETINYVSVGTWLSPAISLNSVALVGSSSISWSAGGNGTITVQTSIDNGSTWQDTISGQQISGLMAGYDCSSTNLLVKATLQRGASTPTISNIAISIVSSSAFTIEAKVNGLSASLDKKFYAECSTANNNTILSVGTDNVSGTRARYLVVNDVGTTLIDLSGTKVITDGGEHRVSVIDNAGVVTILVDGEIDTTGSYARGNLTRNTTSIGAARRASLSGYLAGYVYDVRLWNVACTVSSVLANKDSTLTGNETGLKNYYKLHEGSGSIATDSAANVANGTLYNVSWSNANVVRAVGIKGVDSGKDFYWAESDSIITQDSSSPTLQSSDTLTVQYQGEIAIVAVAWSQPDISSRQQIEGGGTGLVECVEDESDLNSSQAYFEIANAALLDYCVKAQKLTFTTTRDGLMAAQLLRVNLPQYGLNNVEMLIESVDVAPRTVQQNGAPSLNLCYSVTAVLGPIDDTWTQFFKSLADNSQGSGILQNTSQDQIAVLQQSLGDSYAYSDGTVPVSHLGALAYAVTDTENRWVVKPVTDPTAKMAV